MRERSGVVGGNDSFSYDKGLREREAGLELFVTATYAQ